MSRQLPPQPEPRRASLLDDAVLEEAWQWLCKRRRDYPPNADVWWLRAHWAQEKPRLCKQLRQGDYHFEPLQKIIRSDGEVLELWSARDALVLKCMAIVLGHRFDLSQRCTHIKGHSGTKQAVREVVDALPYFRFVMRSDVKSYYASIDHHCVFEQLCERVTDNGLRRLLRHYLRRTVSAGGLYRETIRAYRWAVR